MLIVFGSQATALAKLTPAVSAPVATASAPAVATPAAAPQAPAQELPPGVRIVPHDGRFQVRLKGASSWSVLGSYASLEAAHAAVASL